MLRRFIAVAVLAWLGAPAAWPQDTLRIAAVVNDQAISVLDWQMRIEVAIYNANLARTDEMRQRVAGPVLRNLIDEALQVQEARSKGVRVTDRDVADAVALIEDNNGIARGGLGAFLADRGIALGAVVGQIRAQIAWGTYVNRRLRPTIGVSEEEIDVELARLEEDRGRPEFLVSEITLYDDPAAAPREVQAVAESIVAQLRGGADFAAVAAQFSQGALARNGGDLGWIQEGQSRREIDRTLAAMEVGAISDPVRSVDGFHILHLRNKRAVMSEFAGSEELFLSQVLLPVPAVDSPEAAEQRRAEAQRIGSEVSGCDALRAQGARSETSLSGDLGWVQTDDLPAAFRDALSDLDVGVPSVPLETANGIHVIMVCERSAAGDEADVRDAIYDRIANRRLATIERRLLRDLRRHAFVDLRV